MPTEAQETSASHKDEWLAEVSALDLEGDVRAFWSDRPDLQRRETIEVLTKEVTRLARHDPQGAERLSRAATSLAELVGDDCGHALDYKARGHLRFLVGKYEEALGFYRACQKSFLAAGHEVEAAVNRGSSMWMLALLGRYEEAWEDSRLARSVLEDHSDPLLLARVATNEGNIFLRQDRHPEALECYRNALALFREAGEVQDIAVTLHNIAVSSIAVSDFSGALASYRELGRHCHEHDLGLLAAQADYNIAYLYFFRGEFTRAIEIYQQTRKQCEVLGDEYHLALCDLDQSEIFLELNLRDDAARLAGLAYKAFEQRGNRYEAAKAQTFLAIAASQAGDRIEALTGFSRARSDFEKEGNRAWMAMTDFYRALVHHQLVNPRKGRERCLAARQFFEEVSWTSRVALCDLLLAQIDLQEGAALSAVRRCKAAIRALDELDLPSLSLKAFVALGRAEEYLSRRTEALDAYRNAHVLLEDLRTHLGSEESKIAFLSDKLEVYEKLVAMTLEETNAPDRFERAFVYIEQAKSRILADLVLASGSDLRSSASDNPELVAKVQRLRAELNQHHHELDQLYANRSNLDSPEKPTATADIGGRVLDLRAKSRRCEELLLETIADLRSKDSKFAVIHSAETIDLDSIRESIASDAVLIEYFESSGITYVCILGKRCFQIRALGKTASVTANLVMFASQMSKSQLGEEYWARFGEKTHRTILASLYELYKLLIAPIETLLDCEHLIVVPHGILHQVPFHALYDGQGYLIDRFNVSYSPSASLFAALQTTSERSCRKSLILGVPDSRAPEIVHEVEAVAKLLPDSSLFVGAEATVERLRSLAPESRVVHIATHGFFRKDSPMFSAIQLGGSRLTLLDLYGLEFGAELVVLSGCSTGLHKVESGDELIGLSRGLLYAGARSLVTTLWDVHDQSTASFMKAFYGNLSAGANRAEALARAAKTIRSEHPNPYYWAPFVLIGSYSGSSPLA